MKRVYPKKRPHYKMWWSMIDRCTNPENKSYRNYGGRGISVCEDWSKDYWNFHKWVEQNNWQPSLHIDRFPDKNGDYEPLNCRFATSAQNQNNRRNNIIAEMDGQKKTLSEWAKQYNMSASVVHVRVKSGWDIRAALTTSYKDSRIAAYSRMDRNDIGQFI